MRPNLFRAGIVCIAVFHASSGFPTEPVDPSGVDFFEKHIRPVLVSKCYQCHAADAKKVEGDLLLDTREGLRNGGTTGPAVVPRKTEDSILLEAIRHDGLQMPPNEKLPADVIIRFEQWIKMGAPDPRDGTSAVVPRGIDLAEARRFWAFKPIESPIPPEVADAKWAYTTIDQFVLAALDSQGLRPVPDAEAAPLVRRIYFDLIGLPPSPEEVKAFEAAASVDRQKAIADLVNQLLASSQFGQRWGRHWLDVVRFAESTGMERNYTYPQAWRYRDYVIDSLNSDKPFDEFVREQVAGDLLPAASENERTEQLIATGFLTIGPKGLNERDKELFLMDIVDEQLDTTLRAFMGLTVGCARCHDHKFDAITSQEYYALAGIFRSTETFYGTGNSQGNRHPSRLLALSEGQLVAFAPEGAAEKNGKSKPDSGPPFSIEVLKNEYLAAKSKLAVLTERVESLDGSKQKKGKKRLSEMTQEVERLQSHYETAKRSSSGENPTADNARRSESSVLVMGVLDTKSPRDTELRLRGEPNEKGSLIPRGFLAIGSVGNIPEIDDGSGRLALAEYLTQRDNPLTARVAANRVWGHLFGRAIVGSVDNFGLQGEPPTHPELLDWLATELATNNWSIKHLIRTIVTSRTYQLAAIDDELGRSLDPSNRFLWRANHRRLEAEAIRDAILSVSGQLDLNPPEEGSRVAVIGDVDIGRGQQASRFGVSNQKRSVYLPIVRLVVPDVLQTFDFPEPSNITGARDVTTVATQALYLMNNPFVLEQSQQLAARLLERSSIDDEERVVWAYELAFGRKPTLSEHQTALGFIRTTAAQEAESTKIKAWTAFSQALFASAEFRYLE